MSFGAQEVAPAIDIRYPTLDLMSLDNPIPAILAAPELPDTVRFFAEGPSVTRSLLTPLAQALLYTVIRNQRSEHVVEIGTYKGGTTEALARAVQANQRGTVHTVSPFDGERFGENFSRWPRELQDCVRYHEINSMGFYILSDVEHLQLDLVLVDGNHDYEFANFDIQAAARRLAPGGFIFIDNVAQAGPFFAVIDFLQANPDWTDCGMTPLVREYQHAFELNRTNVPSTDFAILRAPHGYSVGARSRSFGSIPWPGDHVDGMRLRLREPTVRGELRVECILRAFRDDRIDELTARVTLDIESNATELEIKFDDPPSTNERFDRYFVEWWLTWAGERPLLLAAPPAAF